MADDRFLAIFFEEAREVLQALESGLMDLEARAEDRAHLGRTFRAAHTLKGAAGMVGLAPIAAFTHRVEAVLDRIRGGQLAPSAPVVSLLLAAKDHLAEAVEARAEGRDIEPAADLGGQLDALARGEAMAAAGPVEVEIPASASLSTYKIELAPRPDVLRKGIDPLGILDEVRELGETRIEARWDAVPPIEAMDPSTCYLSWSIELRTDADPARVDELFLFLDPPAATEPVPEPETETETAGVSRPIPPVVAPVARVRVDAEQLDELVGMAGELAVLTDSLEGLKLEGAGAGWADTLEALERVGRRLRDATLELRMVEVEELFARFPRVVRDLAERSGKRINLRLGGSETRLDRTIVERLAEPLIHLVRNAVDHGLETPREREAAGKPPTGQVDLVAGHEGDRVAIRVRDDGRGLDRSRIHRKAIERGLLPPETGVGDPSVLGVVFEPGFSTREVAGELSGRGVGLDVVRDTIRALRGEVSVETTPGRGTSFTILLPLTLAMIDGLLVEAAGGRYVVPIDQVEECVELTEAIESRTMGRPSAIFRGDLVPLIGLAEAFGGRPRVGPHRELLLTRRAGQRVGVSVDRLLGRVRAVIQPLDRSLGGLGRYSGGTILADGSACLILDLPMLVAEAMAGRPSPPRGPHLPPN